MPLPVTTGAGADRARSGLQALPHSQTCLLQLGVGCLFPLSSLCSVVLLFSRGAEHDRLGVGVGGDRALVWGWAKEVPDLRLCHHWL